MVLLYTWSDVMLWKYVTYLLIKSTWTQKSTENLFQVNLNSCCNFQWNGLKCIHSQNLIHRDIKPGNVLTSKSPVGNPLAKEGDFGLSKKTTEG